MKKIIMIAVAVALIAAAGFMLMRNRVGIMSYQIDQGNDLVIMNDSTDTISADYKKDGKEIAFTIEPQKEATGGKGFIRIFTAKKAGSYEISYAFPRPAGTPHKITLSEIGQAAQKEIMGANTYRKTGMIGDIKVEYEEPRQLD